MPRSSPKPDPFRRAVEKTIIEHRMIPKDARVLVGVSGGPDSIALARVLMDLTPDPGCRIGIAHLNHGLRGAESDRDQAFTGAFAHSRALAFYGEHQDIAALARTSRTSEEEAGRNARYAFFSHIARTRGYHRIATGHTRDDNAEQVLMSLLRGAGAKGLAGIPPVREDRFIRPLILCGRKDVLAYLDRLGQDFVLDSSNRDTVYLRNRIRRQLIPLLEKAYNPNIRESLVRVSAILQKEDDFLDREAQKGLAACTMAGNTDALTLSAQRLAECHPALVPRILRKAIHGVKSDLKRITHSHILAVQTLMAEADTGKHLDLPGRIRVYKQKKGICIRKEALPLRELGRMEKQSKGPA